MRELAYIQNNPPPFARQHKLIYLVWLQTPALREVIYLCTVNSHGTTLASCDSILENIE